MTPEYIEKVKESGLQVADDIVWLTAAHFTESLNIHFPAGADWTGGISNRIGIDLLDKAMGGKLDKRQTSQVLEELNAKYIYAQNLQAEVEPTDLGITIELRWPLSNGMTQVDCNFPTLEEIQRNRDNQKLGTRWVNRVSACTGLSVGLVRQLPLGDFGAMMQFIQVQMDEA